MTIDLRPSGKPHCPRCATVLPAEALFCPACGERTLKDAPPLSEEQDDITLRYRKKSLLIRRPYVNLFVAVDSQRRRPVAIRDIDVSGLDERGRTEAYEIVEREYDLLRQLSLPIAALTPAIDTGRAQGHLLTIMGDSSFPAHIHTLQDVLQSGAGLPKVALALSWIEHLCATLDQLHRHQIIIGDLDPRLIMLNSMDYSGMPVLFISWLPAALAGILPSVSSASLSTNMTNFIAPEALQGKPDALSDIYSLGALLYLLLTGQPPSGHTQHRQRFPGELNAQVSARLDRVVMQALAPEPAERFQSARSMQEALVAFRSNGRKPVNGKNLNRSIPMTREFREEQSSAEPSLAEIDCEHEEDPDDYSDEDSITVSFVRPSLPVAVVSQATDVPVSEFPADPAVTPLPPGDEEEQIVAEEVSEVSSKSVLDAAPVFSSVTEQAAVEDAAANSLADSAEEAVTLTVTPTPLRPADVTEQATVEDAAASSLADSAEEAVTLTVTPRPLQPADGADEESGLPVSVKVPPSRAIVPYQPAAARSKLGRNAAALFRRIRDTLLGEQRLNVTAAAVIETPLRVQPNQAYTIRIQLMGRDARAGGQIGHLKGVGEDASGKAEHVVGLSALAEGDRVFIEVRSAIYERYAYVVQEAEVMLPATGYASEVTIPLRPLSQGPSGRRDRLHIFFLDESRRPIYEKPFVVELFISHRVQPGHEGHNVLTIPM